jgi:hypothetical protein
VLFSSWPPLELLFVQVSGANATLNKCPDSKKQEPGLPEQEMADHPRSFISGNPFQNLFCGLIQEAQEPDIILLAETME